VHELLEIFVLCGEVGLNVDFDQNAHTTAVVNVGVDDAFRGDAARFFFSAVARSFSRSHLMALSTSPSDATSAFFAVHHAGARHLSQVFYHFCGDVHIP
jgi:hypothetical protein